MIVTGTGVTRGFGGSRMNGVESPDRFHGEGASGVSEDRFGNLSAAATRMLVELIENGIG